MLACGNCRATDRRDEARGATRQVSREQAIESSIADCSGSRSQSKTMFRWHRRSFEQMLAVKRRLFERWSWLSGL